MLAEFLDFNIFSFFLVFTRVGTAMMLLPGFSAVYVNARLRLAVALGVSFASMPLVLPLLPPVPGSVSAMVVLLVSEAIIGAFFGFLGRIALGTLQIMGTFVALFASLASALIQDPVAEQQSSIISNLLTTIGFLLIFVTDFHHLMFEALMETYSIFVPGNALETGDLAMVLVRSLADSMVLALQLSSPFLVVALTYYAGLGVLGRLMPALPLFFFAMPIQIGLQFYIMILTISGTMMVFMNHFQETFIRFVGP